MGINGAAKAGDDFIVLNNEKEAKNLSENRAQENKDNKNPLTFATQESAFTDKSAEELNLIIKSDVHGSSEAIKNAVSQIKDSGVDIEIFDAPKTVDDIISLIDKLSTLLDAKAQGSIVVGEIQSDIVKIDNIISNYDKVPSMVFFMNPSSGGYMAAGKGTIADYLIELMGGDNPFSDDFNKYQRVNKEEILKYNPDIILVASHGGDGKSSLHFTNGSEFESLKSVSNKNVIDISMSNLTMGPSFISNTVSVMEKINIGFGK